MSSARKPFFPILEKSYSHHKSPFENDLIPNAFDQFAIDTKRSIKGLKEINLDDTKT